jgi:integrase
MKIYRNEKGKWCYSFIANGKRERRVIGLSKQEAEAVACEARNKIKREGFGIKRNAGAIYFEDFAREYIELHAKQNKRSWQRDECSLVHLTDYFKGRTLASITPRDIESYKAKRKAEGYTPGRGKKIREVKPATVNLELACLKTLFSKAVEWGKVESNPAAKIKKFKVNNAREKILNADEARRLLENASPALRPVIVVALKTGMRLGEILSLRWPAVNFIKSFILIETSKSGKSRKVPMSTAVRESLKALPRPADFVFYNPETKTHFTTVKTAFKTACHKAVIKGLRFHDLRHTFATWYIEKGGDIASLSKILGHASIQMTMRYCNPTEEGMLQAVERIDAVLDPKPEISAKNSAIVNIAPIVNRSYLNN